MHVASIVFALAAAGFMAAVVAGMVRGEDDDPRGWLLRAASFGCFVAAVVLNALS